MGGGETLQALALNPFPSINRFPTGAKPGAEWSRIRQNLGSLTSHFAYQ